LESTERERSKVVSLHFRASGFDSVARKEARPQANPGVVDQQIDVGALACGGGDRVGFGDVQMHPLDAVERDVFGAARGGVDLSRSGGEEFLRKDQSESSICAGDEGDGVPNPHWLSPFG
jgi:hypothetical protein